MNKSLKSLILFFVVVALVAVLWVNRYTIYDHIVLYNYTPPKTVANLANEDTMTDYAKRLFYVNKPQISDRAQLNKYCKTTEQTAVLGCYTGVSIYIFKVDDKSLNGVEQITAAHEMLHAAYNRLSSSERKHIDSLVDVAYKKLNDKRVNTLAANYEKQEPGSVPNELHSILGTEVPSLGDELENYYKQYFTNRDKVVNYSESYRQVFDNLKDQVDNYDSNLVLRKSQINSLETELEQMQNNIKSQKAKMDVLLASGDTVSYNNEVPSYNADVNAYNDKLAYLKQLIQEYNQIVQERNNVAVQQSNLAQSIDSRLSAMPNQ